MYRKFFKRFFDIIFSLILLPEMLIIVVFTAPFIYFSDRGNIFYIAKRRGRNGKVFDMLKLRTMRKNAPELRNADGSVYTGKDDARVTKVGKLLRRCSLDELPQILNVLKGDMSFIGPRPHLATTDYESLDERRKKRLTVRPGITGYSQAYYRNSVDMDVKIEHDCYYAENVSLALDLKIIFKTVGTVIKGKGVNG